MRSNPLFVLLLVSLILITCACNKTSKSEDTFIPIPAHSLKFTGYFEEDIQRSIENWNKGVVPYDSLVDLFRNGRKFFAQGEMWGKAVRSGSMFYRYTQDPELKKVLKATVEDLLSTVKENGSISCSEVADQPDSQGGDLWERKYVLLGLLGYYTHVEKDPSVLQAMIRQADCIVEQIGPAPLIRIVDQGWSPNHIESSTLLEPMMRLFNLTGKQDYLDFARYIVEEEGGALGHNVIEDAFNNTDPIDIGGAYPKAYEMMSLFEGLVEYYRVTGNEHWKTAALNLFEKIKEKEITIIGNAGGDVHHPAVMGEGWGNTALEQTNPDMNRMMETCVGVTWLKLCSQILRLTGDPSAMDMIEKYAYNGLIGAMKPGGDGFSYVNRLNGSKTITTGWGGIINDVHVSCCNLNGPMGLAYLPYVAVMNSNEGPVINLFNACEASLASPRDNPLELTIETDFPLSGQVVIRVDSPKKERFTLRIRIPEWSSNTLLKVNDQTMDVRPGTYAAIDRTWSPDDLIELELDMSCRILDAPYGSNRSGDYFKALVRGPIVLSRDENMDPEYNEAVSIISEDGYVDIVPEQPTLPGTRMQFQVPSSEGRISMVDYASVNNWNGTHITTWLPTVKADQVKVAAVQLSGYDKTVTPGLELDVCGKVIPYIERASKDSARLVVFPEYCLGRIKVPGKETEALARAAARNNIYVIIGGWEVFEDGSFSNAIFLFGKDGELMGKYYKTHAAIDKYEGQPAYSKPPSGKDEQWFLENDPEWIMKRGNKFPVFDLDFAKIGILTCYDGWFPEPFRILSLKGAEILVWANSRFGAVEDYIVKTAIWHNTVSMICTNQAYGSGTMIADWPGIIKASSAETGEHYMKATLDLKRLRNARAYNRNSQQRRPDIYQEILMEVPNN